MKKFIPLLTVVGASVFLVTGCEGNLTKVETPLNSSINSYQDAVNEYSKASFASATPILSKYNLNIETPLENTFNQDALTLSETEEPILTEDNSNNKEIIENEQINENLTSETETNDLSETEKDETEDFDEEIEQISTLYSLSCDVGDCCEDFCELKEDLTNAIIETKQLIAKLESEEISLTAEQRKNLTDQARQLKNLGRELSNITTELSINLSDLYTAFNKDGLDNLSLKYLVVLDNLVNGNEMLKNGLNSLNIIRNLITFNRNDDNSGNLTYGYQRNNEEPIIKNYDIKENGEIVENVNADNETNNETDEKNIDTYQNNRFKSNIDTYGNSKTNIDSFFNTAWLDNDFMYGNGYNNGMNNGFGYNNGYMPYVENRKSVQNDNTTNSVNSEINTQENEDLKPVKRKKKFKLEKNIDTYRDESTPTVSAKLTVIKDSISGFLNKFKNEDEDINVVKEKFNS